MSTQVYLRSIKRSDEAEFVALARASRALHHPWVSPPSTAQAFRAFVKRMGQASNEGFLVCRRRSHEIVGAIEVTEIVRGVFRSAYLSYYVFAGHERQGFLGQGLRLAVRRAFTALGLHRLEANIQPGNVASIALVESCGFSKEGYSPRYLKIRGRWRDHERWAILAS